MTHKLYASWVWIEIEIMHATGIFPRVLST